MKRIWIFPGQGAQSARMGQKFLAWPEFAAVLDRIASATGQPLPAMLTSWSEAELLRTDRAQLAIFAMSAGLAACLRAAGHSPDLVAGHSLGHFSALVAAGALTLEDAARLVAARGQAMREGGERVAGSMGVVLGLPGAKVAALLAASGLPVWVANRNLADQTVVSGRADALPEARRIVQEAGGRWGVLAVSGAFHSPLLAPEAERFAADIAAVPMADPRLPVLANGSGQALCSARDIRADLRGHMTGQVVWTAVMDRIASQAGAQIVEVGPGKILTGLMLRHAPHVRPMPTCLPPLLERVLASAPAADLTEEKAA